MYENGEGLEPEVLRLLRLALDQGNQAAEIVTEHLSRISSQIGSLVRPKPVRLMHVLPHRLLVSRARRANPPPSCSRAFCS
jgi:hypothetical protein